MDEHLDYLEEGFPLGDGIADTDADAFCPCCGEPVTIALDPGGGATQQYMEDCQVCCRPWYVQVTYRSDGSAEVRLDSADS